jgi:signal transduction histidine kinase
MSRRDLLSVAIVASVLLCSTSDPTLAQQALREMHHTMWTARDGAPQAIKALAQGPDGTLWIGSESGLFNFDGLAFRPPVSPAGDPAVPSSEVASLLVTRDGTLWVSFVGEGIARIAAGRVTLFTTIASDLFDTIVQLREGPDGSIWAVEGGRLIRFGRDGRWGREIAASPTSVSGVFVDSANTVWIVQDGLLRRRAEGAAAFTSTDVRADVVLDFVETPQHDIWLSDFDVSASVGRTRLVSASGHLVRSLPQGASLGGHLAVAADGSLIVASDSGLHRYPPRPPGSGSAPMDSLDREHGLSSAITRATTIDLHGNIWAGGLRGLDRLSPRQLKPFMPDAEASRWAVCGSPKGDLWVANISGDLYSVTGETARLLSGITRPLLSLSCADGGRAWFVDGGGMWSVGPGGMTALPPIAEVGPRQVIKLVAANDALYATVAGPFWRGGIWRLAEGRWTKLPGDGERAAGGFATYVDRRQRLWVGHAEGRAVVHAPAGAQAVTWSAPGLGTVFAFLDTTRGMFTGGTQGLAVLRDSQFEVLTFAAPAVAHGIRGLVEDGSGALWLNTADGVVQIAASELDAALASRGYPIKTRRIRDGDSAGAGQYAIGYVDSAARGADGRLWFATRSGVVHLAPDSIPSAPQPPAVVIRGLVADGLPMPHSHVLTPAVRSLAVQYAGINLSAPESVIYRYRLEGFDDGWIDAGRRTEASYTRLPPGRYTFNVMASNGDGIWTAPVSSAPFSVPPTFYQTRGFVATTAGLAVLVALGVHRLRVRQIARLMSARFDERLAERTRVARDLHDTLLQTVHGSKLVADRALRDTGDRDQLARALEQLSGWLGQAAAEGRAALQSLRASTVESNDLAGAFRRAIDECRQDSAAELSLSVQGRPRDLHPVVRDEIYRIGYEALRNACVHAKATRIDMVLEYGHHLTLRLRDNGVGIDDGIVRAGRDGHFGLRGMRERAERIGAAFSLTSSPGDGTAITLDVPGRLAHRAGRSNGRA